MPALRSIQRIEKEMGTKLYVGNLSFRTTSDELKDAFAAVGTVESASVIEDRDTGRSRGFAFVEMATAEEAAAAIEQFNGKDFGGRNLTVNEAKPMAKREGFGGGGEGPSVFGVHGGAFSENLPVRGGRSMRREHARKPARQGSLDGRPETAQRTRRRRRVCCR